MTSLRRDGVPVSLPVWFVVDDRSVLVAGPAASHKFTRIRRDGRIAFLVESGEAWKDLRAVHLIGRADLVERPDWESVDALFEAKYLGFRTPREEMPASARARYDGARWRQFATGAWGLEDALAVIDCAVEEIIERHSHGIIIGAVRRVHVGGGDQALIYGHGRYRALGLA